MCCHQLCNYSRYINHPFLDRIGLNREDFEFCKLITTWGICGQRTDQIGKEHWSLKTFEQRTELGLKMKRILDMGRLEFLQEMGFNAELVYYVDRKYSGENMALIAKFA